MTLSPDCLILGGGIAGLWTLRALLSEGYDAVLVETSALGTGQTIASQAILHAGTKYALTGQAAGASKAAGEAATVWRARLRGEPGGPDLSSVRVVSQHTWMFTTPGVASRLTGLAASKALASGPQKVPKDSFPPAFAGAPGGVDVYELDEPVLDLPSLLHTLAEPVRDRFLVADQVAIQWHRLPAGGSDSGHEGPTASVQTGAGAVTLAPRALICAAGGGNEALLDQLGLSTHLRMQRRPLHMVLARGASLPPLFAHCVSLSDKPRATITTATDALGRPVWYIGGQLAESGVECSRDEQIATARAELAKIIPWVDMTGVEFATHRVDRAEGFDAQGRRPDTPVVRREGPVIACWPTKLVLAPLASRAVHHELTELGVEPSGARTELPDAPAPTEATPIWDREDLPWT